MSTHASSASSKLHTTGAPNVRQFVDEVARIGLANPELQKVAADLIKSADSAATLGIKLRETDLMLKLLAGGSLSEAEKKMLGLSTSTGSAVSSYENLIQRTRDRITELNFEAETADRTSGAVMKLKLMHDLERAAKQSNISDTGKLRAEWDKLADSMVAATRASAAARLRNDLSFERDQLFRSDTDQNIANRLRGTGLPVDFNSIEAGMIRANEGLRTMRDLTLEVGSSFRRDFEQGLDSGMSKAQAFGDAMSKALTRIGDKLLDIAMNDAINGLFRNLGGGGGGGGILSLFGGNSTGVGLHIPGGFSAAFPKPFANGGVMSSRGPMPLNYYDRGGIANSPQVAIFGEGRTPEAYVPLPDGRSIPVSVDIPQPVANPAMPQNVHVTVSFDENGNLQAVIEKTSARVSKASVASFAESPEFESRAIRANRDAPSKGM